MAPCDRLHVPLATFRQGERRSSGMEVSDLSPSLQCDHPVQIPAHPRRVCPAGQHLPCPHHQLEEHRLT
eukprot:scaffold9005_cov39-Tisochrysis_lutea.AAC.3